MWFILSLISIFFWSGSDFFSKLGSPAKDKDSHLKMLMVVGLVMGAHATSQVLFQGVSFTKEILIAYLPVSFLYISSMLLGYIGLRYIELSVSSPICNTSGAVAALLSFIFLKQVLALPQLFAILLILFAIYLLSYLQKKREDTERKKMQEKVEDKYVNSFIAIFFPIFYCIIDGLGTFLDAVVLEKIPEASANVAYEYTFCTLAVCLFFYLVFVKKTKFSLPTEEPKFLGAICETIGQFTYIYAIGANAVASAPLISSYCLFSVIWARIFLKEKLSKAQYFAVGLAVLGILILGFFEEG